MSALKGGVGSILMEMRGLFCGETPNPSEQALIDEQMNEIDAALAELPPNCRDVPWLSGVEGLTHTEVVKRLGVSRSLVEKYLVRSVLHCRARLDGLER